MEMFHIYDYYNSMSSEDFQLVAKALITTLSVGVPLLGFFLYYIYNKFGDGAQQRKQEERKRGFKFKPRHPIHPKGDDVPECIVEDVGNVEKNDNDVKGAHPAEEVVEDNDDKHKARKMPRGAATVLLARADRLLKDKSYDDALVCYLSPLYVAIENKDDSSLPTNLTDCLRGAAKCYRESGRPDLAVKFLQAERCVFEEMVAQVSNPNHEAATHTSILQSLFDPESAKDAAGPRRYRVLNEVADSCEKLGHTEVALAYRVKAAALKQRFSGEALSPDSTDFTAIAHTLGEYQRKHADNTARPSDPTEKKEELSARSHPVPSSTDTQDMVNQEKTASSLGSVVTEEKPKCESSSGDEERQTASRKGRTVRRRKKHTQSED